MCLNITAPWFTALAADKQAGAAKKMADLLESEKAGFDVGAYRDAPPGLRIWCGATVETCDLEALLPWLDWAYGEIEREFSYWGRATPVARLLMNHDRATGVALPQHKTEF